MDHFERELDRVELPWDDDWRAVLRTYAVWVDGGVEHRAVGRAERRRADSIRDASPSRADVGGAAARTTGHLSGLRAVLASAAAQERDAERQFHFELDVLIAGLDRLV